MELSASGTRSSQLRSRFKYEMPSAESDSFPGKPQNGPWSFQIHFTKLLGAASSRRYFSGHSWMPWELNGHGHPRSALAEDLPILTR